MCGRYALGIRAAFVRHQLQEHDMPVDEAPEDDEVRQTYNFAPGNYGLVYRADVPDYGAGQRNNDAADASEEDTLPEDVDPPSSMGNGKDTKYKLQAMKWGLVPFWTKRNPDYGSLMKTINARDDSLIENRGMWNTMKQRKRCIVIAQGFYEWLKKNDGKEKIPHYTKRKDGQLMCIAGLWDCAKYEGSDDKLYTYTIITTDSNQQLKFLHDRMPVILDNDSGQIGTWLDPNRSEWSKELQSLLKPFTGELECYPVSKDVGKVGNNSPAFIIPVASLENKNNIANFFLNAKAPSKRKEDTKAAADGEAKSREGKGQLGVDVCDIRDTMDVPETEHNAPMPTSNREDRKEALKRKFDNEYDGDNEPASKVSKKEASISSSTSSPKSRGHISRKTRSATTNKTALKASPAKASDGSQRITNFFNK